MVFGPRRNTPSCCVMVGGVVLLLVTSYKYLGVVLSPPVSWTAPVQHLVEFGNRFVRTRRFLVPLRASPLEHGIIERPLVPVPASWKSLVGLTLNASPQVVPSGTLPVTVFGAASQTCGTWANHALELCSLKAHLSSMCGVVPGSPPSRSRQSCESAVVSSLSLPACLWSIFFHQQCLLVVVQIS